MDTGFRGPAETAEFMMQYAERKDKRPLPQMFVLSILAGAFIAFASQGSNAAVHTIASVGLAKTLAGALFATGLMLVVFSGAELFTGNMLMILPCLNGKIKVGRMLRSWLVTYAGNFVGSLIIVGLIVLSGQLDMSHGLLGGFTIKLAAAKAGLPWLRALAMGILCNWLVCMAVWMSGSARDAVGKLVAIFFPIWLFITSGFEHSIANMYYIPAGLLALSNPAYVAQATELGVTSAQLAGLNWGTFVLNNLLPVTLGNMIGGIVFVGMASYFVFLKKAKR